jgi:23S rRNA A1618 N6-methylase RlmF
LKDLLRESSTLDDGRFFEESPVPLVCKGLDIGTGCSCIYPLLLSRDVFTEGKRWQFLATDIDPFSIECAQENVNANHLQDVIQLALVPKTDDKGGPRCFNQVNSEESFKCNTPIFTALNKARELYKTSPFRLDFCMKNPPFYSCESEASAPRAGDQRERTDMAFHESVYPGGERGFALDMMYDSLVYRDEVTWYSLMVSKKTNLIALQKDLENIGLSRGSIRTVEFDQGKMKRWGIAWTFLTPCVRSPGK